MIYPVNFDIAKFPGLRLEFVFANEKVYFNNIAVRPVFGFKDSDHDPYLEKIKFLWTMESTVRVDSISGDRELSNLARTLRNIIVIDKSNLLLGFFLGIFGWAWAADTNTYEANEELNEIVSKKFKELYNEKLSLSDGGHFVTISSALETVISEALKEPSTLLAARELIASLKTRGIHSAEKQAKQDDFVNAVVYENQYSADYMSVEKRQAIARLVRILKLRANALSKAQQSKRG